MSGFSVLYIVQVSVSRLIFLFFPSRSSLYYWKGFTMTKLFSLATLGTLTLQNHLVDHSPMGAPKVPDSIK